MVGTEESETGTTEEQEIEATDVELTEIQYVQSSPEVETITEQLTPVAIVIVASQDQETGLDLSLTRITAVGRFSLRSREPFLNSLWLKTLLEEEPSSLISMQVFPSDF